MLWGDKQRTEYHNGACQLRLFLLTSFPLAPYILLLISQTHVTQSHLSAKESEVLSILNWKNVRAVSKREEGYRFGITAAVPATAAE